MADISLPDASFEYKFWKSGMLPAGIDEAGRGCIAGPVVAAAVILKDDKLIASGVNDSKKLKPIQRQELLKLIMDSCFDFAYEFVSVEIIEQINILQASILAMEGAVNKLNTTPDHLLIDGNRYKSSSIPYTTIVGGDSKSISIASASIVAKVTRDTWMTDIAHQEYPQYGFDKHKGYGTKEHFQNIEKFGICPLHRLSFLSRFLDKDYTLF